MQYSNELTNNGLIEVGQTGGAFIKHERKKLIQSTPIMDNKRHYLEKLGITAPVSADEKQLNTMLKKATKKSEISTETVPFASETEPENEVIEKTGSNFSLNWKWYALGTVLVLGLGTFIWIKKFKK